MTIRNIMMLILACGFTGNIVAMEQRPTGLDGQLVVPNNSFQEPASPMAAEWIKALSKDQKTAVKKTLRDALHSRFYPKGPHRSLSLVDVVKGGFGNSLSDDQVSELVSVYAPVVYREYLVLRLNTTNDHEDKIKVLKACRPSLDIAFLLDIYIEFAESNA